MSRMKTLNTIAELQRSGFGQPPPRHGLRLLYWFVNDCVEVNPQNRMISLCSPGDFGFRVFHNREERGKGHLLPDSSTAPYYELGNLSVFGVKSLPEYVREKYTGFQDKSNTDRIIVSLESGTFFRSIYVTRHETRMNFDPSHTFCVGLELVRSMKNMRREDFLRAAKRRRNVRPRGDTPLRAEQPHRDRVVTPGSEPQLLTPPHTAPQPRTAPRHTHHPHKAHTDTTSPSHFCFILLFLLTTALLLPLTH